MPVLKNREMNSPISLNDIKKKIGQFGSDLAYFESNQDKLLLEYNESWVAIFNCELVAHDKSFTSLIRKLSRIGLSDDQVVIKYISNKEVIALYFR